MQFAERIKFLRDKERYSQAQLGELVGVKPNTVWRWENSKAKPDFETVSKIAHVLNTTAAYLLGETEVFTPLRDNEVSLPLINKSDDLNQDMLIIQDGERKYFIPNNDEGRKLFISILANGLNDGNIPIVSNSITGSNNNDNKLGLINN